MPQLRTKLSERMANKCRAKEREFLTAFAEISQMADVLFIGTPRDVDLCALRRLPTTFVHDLAGRLVCQKCKGTGKRPAATLLQLAPRQRHRAPEGLGYTAHASAGAVGDSPEPD